MALSLFPSSERSQHKTQADKAHRLPLDDFMAVSKAEGAPERSLVQPPAHDKKRLRDCSSERSEGRLPRPGLSGGAWALLLISLSPPRRRGNALLVGLLTACVLRLLLPAGPESRLQSENASLSCRVHLSIGHFWQRWSFSPLLPAPHPFVF